LWPGQDLASFPYADLVVIVVADAHLEFGCYPAAGPRHSLLVESLGNRDAGLRRPVNLHYGEPEPLLERRSPSWNRHPPGQSHRIVSIIWPRRGLFEYRQRGTHEVEYRGRVIAHLTPEIRCRESAPDGGGGARQERRHGREGSGIDMKKGEWTIQDVIVM